MNAVKWAIACLAFNVSLFSQAPTNSLVAHFKLDGGLRDETGTVTSGVNGGATFVSDRFGNTASAIYFNGSSSVNFGDVTILDGSNVATWSFWMKTNQVPPAGGEISVVRKNLAWIPLQWANDPIASTWRTPLFLGVAVAGPCYGSLPNLSDGTWHNLTIVLNGISVTTYLDGRQVPIVAQWGGPQTGAALRDSSEPFLLGGAEYSPNAERYVGALDDLRIYRRALSAVEVSQLHQAESSAANSPPAISAQPSGQSLLVGQSFQLNVTASGSSPLSYQWLKSGAVIAGATASSYSVASASTADTGAYTVTISNAFGSVTSSPATVTVTTPPLQAPVFTQQPASIAKTVGSSHSFSVSVTGYPVPALQWLKNGVRLSGQNSATLTFASITAGDAANYTCEASNASGTNASQPAVLSVGLAPSVIRSLPVTTVEAKIGDPLRIDLPPLAGTPPLSYRWSLGSSVIAGSGDVLQIGALTSASAGLYSCTISNAYGSVQVDRVRVTLVAAPRITTQPASATITATGNATFSVTASGTPSYIATNFLGHGTVNPKANESDD